MSRERSVPGAPDTELGDASRADHSGADSGGSSVNTALTPKRQIEAPEYAAAVRRMTAVLGRRVAGGDIEALADLAGLTDHLDQVVRDTVAALRRDHGYSWSEIGRTLGTTRQGAQQRWGSPS